MNHFATFFFICLIAGQTFAANTFYVWLNSPNASDAYNTTQAQSSSTPWASIAKAAANVSSGDTVRVLPGNYTERVTISTSGADSDHFINFIGTNGVTVLGFDATSKNYNRLMGFEITHADVGAQNYPAIQWLGGTGNEFINNYIHHIDTNSGGAAIRIGNNSGTIIRSNTISVIGQQTLPETGNICITITSTSASGNIVEYNRMSYASDYLNTAGTGFIARNNLLGPSYSSATVHIDFMQNNAKSILGLLESNYSLDNNSSDNHFYLNQDAGTSTNWVLRGNVLIRTKGLFDVYHDVLHFYHNSVINTLVYYDSDFQMLFNVSTGNYARNNLWWKAVKGTTGPYKFHASGPSDLNADYENWFVSGTNTQTHGTNGDPNIVSANDATLGSTSSAAYMTAGGVTTANGSGSSATALIVATGTAGAFYAGDMIKVGNSGSMVSISSVNLATDTLTLGTASTWADGDPVYWRGQRDIGAYPYKSGGYTITATISEAPANTWTVTPNDTNLVRRVDFFENGIPVTPVSTYVYTSSGGTVSAIVRPLYASETLGIPATVYMADSGDISFPSLDPAATDSVVVKQQKVGVSLRRIVDAARRIAAGGGGGSGFTGQEYDTDANAPTFDTDASALVKDTSS